MGYGDGAQSLGEVEIVLVLLGQPGEGGRYIGSRSHLTVACSLDSQDKQPCRPERTDDPFIPLAAVRAGEVDMVAEPPCESPPLDGDLGG